LPLPVQFHVAQQVARLAVGHVRPDRADIADHVEPRQEPRILKDETRRGGLRGGTAGHLDPAVEITVDPGDNPQKGGLADARRADQGQNLTRLHIDAQALEQRLRGTVEPFGTDIHPQLYALRHPRTLASTRRITRYSNAITTAMKAIV